MSEPIVYYRPREYDTKNFFEKFQRISANRIYTNKGPTELELTEHIKNLHGVKYCSLVSNATIGLQILIRALDLKGSIITTPFTFVATAHAISWQGLNPVFVDIEETTLTINPKLIPDSMRSDVSGILGVHVFGIPCQVKQLDEISKNYQLKVFYDAAHCFSTKLNGVSVGNFGEAEVFSFHSTKLFHTFEGGAILTNNESLYKKLEQLKNFGFSDMDTVSHLGTNAKLNEVSCAFGLSTLPYLSETIQRLKQVHLNYRKVLKNYSWIRLISNQLDEGSNYQYFPVVIDPHILGCSRDEVWAYLWGMGVQTRRYFYPSINEIPFYSNLNTTHITTPVAARISRNILCLPCYFDLTDEQIEKIGSTFSEINKNSDIVKLWVNDFLSQSHVSSELQVVHRALKRVQNEK